MTTVSRILALSVLAIGLVAGCLEGDVTSPTPDNLSTEETRPTDSKSEDTPDDASVYGRRCGTCDPAEECCLYNGGCFIPSPDGQNCV
ncbi:MAG: hypothetical protein R3B48_30280 [Kofleriaceae bacterium]